MTSRLEWTDFISLGAYFILVVGFGVWSLIPKKNRDNVNGYFLAGRSMNFIPVGASLFSSNIGSGHLIGLAGAGTASGIGIFGFEASAPFILVLLGWVFVPVYMKAGVFTMPEYLQKRFGGDRIRIYLSILSLILYVTTKISADLFSGALFIRLCFNLDLYLSIGILLIISAIFTIGGGLTTVIWTDFIQTIIMTLGALYLMIASFIKVGGYESMKTKYSYAVPKTTLYSNSTCGLPPKDYMDLIRDLKSDYPWTGMTLGVLINSVWYWCSDQVIVQRALAAKNLTHAKAGCLVASFLKFLPLFLIIMPGMVARVLFTDEVACVDPAECMKYCESPNGCSNLAYPRMVIDLLPAGARGLMLAVMMSALMSSLTSIFNSSSTIVSMDIWKRIRKDAKDWELMIIGKLTVIVLVIISILWIPIIKASQGSRLFDYIQSTMSYLAPPVSAIYLLAIFVKRINEKGAFWGLIVGLAVGLTRSIWELLYEKYPCPLKHLDSRPAIISKVHYLHFRFILFFLTIIVAWVVSILTKPIPNKYIKRLTFFSLNDPDKPIQIPSDSGLCGKGFCTGANLSEDDGSNNDENEKMELTEQPNKSAKLFLPEDIPNEKVSPIKNVVLCLFGVKSQFKNKNKEVNTEIDTSIDEDPFWSMICDVFAIIAMSCCGFMAAFFNNYNK